MALEHPHTQVFVFVVQEEAGIKHGTGGTHHPHFFHLRHIDQHHRSAGIPHVQRAVGPVGARLPRPPWPAVVELFAALRFQQLRHQQGGVPPLLRRRHQVGNLRWGDQAVRVQQQRIRRFYFGQAGVVGSAIPPVLGHTDQARCRQLGRHRSTGVVTAGVVHHGHMRHAAQPLGQRGHTVAAVVGDRDHGHLVQQRGQFRHWRDNHGAQWPWPTTSPAFSW